MRILILSRALPCHSIGGLEKYTMMLAKGLADNPNYDVHILSTRHPDNIQEKKENNITFHFIPNSKPGKYNFETFRLFHFYAKDLDKKYNFDIFHSQGFAGCLLEKEKNKKIIVSPHGTIFSETSLEKDLFSSLSVKNKIIALWRNKKRIAFIQPYKRLLFLADYIHADSEFIEKKLSSQYPNLKNKIKVIPLGIPSGYYPAYDYSAASAKLNKNPGKVIFFALGRHTELKGFDLIIKAASKIKNKDFEIWLGGTGNMTNYYRNLANTLLGDKVKFLGRISDEKLPEYYSASDYFIIPEISCPAFGLVAVEALMQNTPVISSDAGALPEVVSEKCGIIFRRNNISSLAEALEKAIDKIGINKNSENSLREKKTDDLRKYILEKFPFNKMIDEITKLYSRGSSEIE